MKRKFFTIGATCAAVVGAMVVMAAPAGAVPYYYSCPPATSELDLTGTIKGSNVAELLEGETFTLDNVGAAVSVTSIFGLVAPNFPAIDLEVRNIKFAMEVRGPVTYVPGSGEWSAAAPYNGTIDESQAVDDGDPNTPITLTVVMPGPLTIHSAGGNPPPPIAVSAFSGDFTATGAVGDLITFYGSTLSLEQRFNSLQPWTALTCGFVDDVVPDYDFARAGIGFLPPPPPTPPPPPPIPAPAAAAATVAPPVEPAPELPRTGSSNGVLALFGIGFVVMGAALVRIRHHKIARVMTP